MYPQHLLIPIFAASVLLFTGGCERQAPPANEHPSPSPAAPSATPRPSTSASTPTPGRNASAVALPADDGPSSWPLTVVFDQDHRAVPPAPDRMARWRPDLADAGGFVRVANSDWRRADAPGVSQVWKVVDRLPVLRGGPAEAGRLQIFHDGTRAEWDSETGEIVLWDENGFHILPPADARTSRQGPGASEYLFARHVNDPVHGVTEEIDNGDGTSTLQFLDGSSLKTSPATGPYDMKDAYNGGSGMAGKYNDFFRHMDDGSGNRKSKGTGEPHYETHDGTYYTTQAAGEFVLVTGVPGRELQARQQPYMGFNGKTPSDTASAITALAMRVGANKVEVRVDGRVRINGEAALAGDFVRGELPGGGAVGVWRSGGMATDAVVIWPDLSVTWVKFRPNYLNFLLQWRGLAPQHRGLLGSNDGDPANDLTDRAGKVSVANDPVSLAAFVESWRVTDAESLFAYGPGESTATYTLKDFPKAPPDLATRRAEAEAAAASLPPGRERENCIYDIAATGDLEFVKGYQEFAKLLATARSASPAPTPSPSAAATATPPVESGDGIAITPAEMAAAAPMASGQTFKMKLGAGESRVYKFIPGKTDNLTIYPANLTSLAAYQPGVDAGFAWFDDKGKMLGKPHQVHDDGPSPLEHPTGTFYLKIVGPGDVDIGHH